MSSFQIVSVLFALFMAYTVLIHSKKKTLSATESSFWYSVWSLFVVISLFPGLLNGIALTLHFARVFDLLIVVALMILSILTFNIYFADKRLNQRIEELVRKQSISTKIKLQHDKTAKN